MNKVKRNAYMVTTIAVCYLVVTVSAVWFGFTQIAAWVFGQYYSARFGVDSHETTTIIGFILAVACLFGLCRLFLPCYERLNHKIWGPVYDKYMAPYFDWKQQERQRLSRGRARTYNADTDGV
jgi:hypothetical protein